MSTLYRLPPHLLVLAALGIGALAHASGSSHRGIVNKVPPVYPELARRMHVSGTVVMHLVVQPDGSVSDARVESGHALLTPAAEQAVRHWKFERASDTTDMTVDVNFSDRP